MLNRIRVIGGFCNCPKVRTGICHYIRFPVYLTKSPSHRVTSIVNLVWIVMGEGKIDGFCTNLGFEYPYKIRGHFRTQRITPVVIFCYIAISFLIKPNLPLPGSVTKSFCLCCFVCFAISRPLHSNKVGINRTRQPESMLSNSWEGPGQFRLPHFIIFAKIYGGRPSTIFFINIDSVSKETSTPELRNPPTLATTSVNASLNGILHPKIKSTVFLGRKLRRQSEKNPIIKDPNIKSEKWVPLASLPYQIFYFGPACWLQTHRPENRSKIVNWVWGSLFRLGVVWLIRSSVSPHFAITCP